MDNGWVNGVKDSLDIMVKNGQYKIETPQSTGNGFWDFLLGWKHSLDIMLQNGQYKAPQSSGMPVLDILTAVATVGVLLNMAGLRTWGNKLLLGSILGGCIWTVITSV